MNISELIYGIEEDLKSGYYNEGDIICFDLVIVYDEVGLRKFIIDNKYKLSKSILDLDYGKEAVIIPLNIEPLKLVKKTFKIDISFHFMDYDKRNNYLYTDNIQLIKKMINIVTKRYGYQEKCHKIKGVIE